jgi:non-canonical (house-cleaning) NTP pyrophosphatase
VAVPVDAGVGDQPTGRFETVAGAAARARNGRAAGGDDTGVVSRAGVATAEEAPGL